MCDEQTEDAAAAWWVRHLRDDFGIHAEVEELVDRSLGIKDAERAVFGVREVGRRRDDAIQGRMQIEPRNHVHDCAEQETLATFAHARILPVAVRPEALSGTCPRTKWYVPRS